MPLADHENQHPGATLGMALLAGLGLGLMCL